jgi:hypothetical protein
MVIPSGASMLFPFNITCIGLSFPDRVEFACAVASAALDALFLIDLVNLFNSSGYAGNWTLTGAGGTSDTFFRDHLITQKRSACSSGQRLSVMWAIYSSENSAEL